MARSDELSINLPSHLLQNYLALNAEGVGWREIAVRARYMGDEYLGGWAEAKADEETAAKEAPAEKRAAAAAAGDDVTPRTAKAHTPKRTAD